MFRVKTAVSVALLLLGACLFAPPVVAAAGDQVVRVQDGQVRCLLSSNFRDRATAHSCAVLPTGGVRRCADVDREVSGAAESRHHGRPGSAVLDRRRHPGAPADDVVLGVGETYQANGWTVMPQELRTLIRNDRFDQEITVAPGEVRKR